MTPKKSFLAACLLLILLVAMPVFAGTITGQIQTETLKVLLLAGILAMLRVIVLRPKDQIGRQR